MWPTGFVASHVSLFLQIAVVQVLYDFIYDEFIPKAARVIPGKI